MWKRAAFWSSLGFYFHQGQVCAAGSRIFVHEAIKTEFPEAFQRHIDEAKYADPLQSQGIADIVGPLAASQHREKVASMVQAGKGAGFEWWEGQRGTKPPHENYLPRGYFFNAHPGHDVASKEIFGPVACISTFSSVAQAVKLANATEYGLSANVFSRNIDTALILAAQIEAGTIWVNCTAMLDASTPFGGVKQSGNGRDGGDEALDLYLSTKTVKILLEPSSAKF